MSVDLSRRVLRKLHFSRGRSSYPFLSGDTYAHLCSMYFDRGKIFHRRDRGHQQFDTPSLFLNGIEAEVFLDFLTSTTQSFENINLIIHNCDKIPNNEEMLHFSKLFKRVFSVNWLGSREIATPIPIGLENWGWQRNGVPRDFSRLISQGLPSHDAREINLLSSFSVSTNRFERTKALDFLNTYPYKFQSDRFMSPKTYRELVLKSRFVISPPGNGPDCHRTWEAMYLGAVPIVLNRYWPFSPEDLPVLCVNEWTEIPRAIENYIPTNPCEIGWLRDTFMTDLLPS